MSRRLGGLLLASVLTACSAAEPVTPRGAVILVVDTLRADHLGAYGYERNTSPRIDAFARTAALFENAVSPSPWTLPAVATLMTSLYPSVHGARTRSDVWNVEWLLTPERFRPTTDLDASRTTLAETLASAGFATAAFVQGAYPSRAFGLDQGFERFDDNASPGLRFDVEAALDWLDRVEGPFLVYLHSVEVHAPYAPPSWNEVFAARWPEERRVAAAAVIDEERERYLSIDFDPAYTGTVDGSIETLAALEGHRRLSQRDRDHLVALYDRGIAYTDYWFGRLLDGLAERGLAEATLVILTSDHGEEFLEHAGLQHSRTYYEEMLRVPLIVRVPGFGEGRRIAAQVGLVDVLPTLMAAFGVPIDGPFQGRSFLPLLRGEPLPERDQFGEASQVAGLRAVRTNEWKYVRHAEGREELYDLRRDPGEQSDRCRSDGEACQRLRERLAVWEREAARVAAELGVPDSEPVEVDAATRTRLEELGYANPEAPVSRPRTGASAPGPQ